MKRLIISGIISVFTLLLINLTFGHVECNYCHRRGSSCISELPPNPFVNFTTNGSSSTTPSSALAPNKTLFCDRQDMTGCLILFDTTGALEEKGCFFHKDYALYGIRNGEVGCFRPPSTGNQTTNSTACRCDHKDLCDEDVLSGTWSCGANCTGIHLGQNTTDPITSTSSQESSSFPPIIFSFIIWISVWN